MHVSVLSEHSFIARIARAFGKTASISETFSGPPKYALHPNQYVKIFYNDQIVTDLAEIIIWSLLDDGCEHELIVIKLCDWLTEEEMVKKLLKIKIHACACSDMKFIMYALSKAPDKVLEGIAALVNSIEKDKPITTTLVIDWLTKR